MRTFTRNLVTITGILFAVPVLPGAVQAGFSAEDGTGFADFRWESARFHNRVAGFLIENRWNPFVKTHPQLWKARGADPGAVERIARALD